MSTLIVYGSKYGCTEKCVKNLEKHLAGKVVSVNVGKETVPPIKTFDKVIIGTPIYMGQSRKEIKTFCATYAGELTSKKIGLFLCCGSYEQFGNVIKTAFPVELLEVAKAKACFGGELNLDKMGFTDKLIAKLVIKVSAKQGLPPAALHTENIESFTKAMNSL